MTPSLWQRFRVTPIIISLVLVALIGWPAYWKYLDSRTPFRDTTEPLMFNGREPVRPEPDGRYIAHGGDFLTIIRNFCLRPVQDAKLDRMMTKDGLSHNVVTIDLEQALIGQCPATRHNTLPIPLNMPPGLWHYTVRVNAQVNPLVHVNYLVTDWVIEVRSPFVVQNLSQHERDDQQHLDKTQWRLKELERKVSQIEHALSAPHYATPR